jgi:GDP-L-fucose synthase
VKILITGKNGLVGKALQSQSTNHEFVFIGREEADLTKESEVEMIFRLIKPDYVIHTAAKVGGIGGNIEGPADMFYQNMLMNSFVIHHACKYGVKKLLAFSSVCVFPDNIPVLKEDLMHKGEPFYSQFAYASAKRAIDTQIVAYKKQYGIKNYCSIIPCNIFGKDDMYNLQTGHVIPSLIAKVYAAKHNKTPLHVWGDGSAQREFIYSDDLAKIILKIIELDDIPERIIVSSDVQISIKEVVEKLCLAADFTGDVIWDTSKPNGQKSRPCDISLLNSLIGYPEYTDFDIALKKSYDWYENNRENVRW